MPSVSVLCCGFLEKCFLECNRFGRSNFANVGVATVSLSQSQEYEVETKLCRRRTGGPKLVRGRHCDRRNIVKESENSVKILGIYVKQP